MRSLNDSIPNETEESSDFLAQVAQAQHDEHVDAKEVLLRLFLNDVCVGNIRFFRYYEGMLENLEQAKQFDHSRKQLDRQDAVPLGDAMEQNVARFRHWRLLHVFAALNMQESLQWDSISAYEVNKGDSGVDEVTNIFSISESDLMNQRDSLQGKLHKIREKQSFQESDIGDCSAWLCFIAPACAIVVGGEVYLSTVTYLDLVFKACILAGGIVLIAGLAFTVALKGVRLNKALVLKREALFQGKEIERVLPKPV